MNLFQHLLFDLVAPDSFNGVAPLPADTSKFKELSGVEPAAHHFSLQDGWWKILDPVTIGTDRSLIVESDHL